MKERAGTLPEKPEQKELKKLTIKKTEKGKNLTATIYQGGKQQDGCSKKYRASSTKSLANERVAPRDKTG